jgi:hypothetical protein
MEDPVKDQKKEMQYITRLALYAILLGMTLVAFIVMPDQMIIVTAVPKISVQFNSLKDIGKSSFVTCFARG